MKIEHDPVVIGGQPFVMRTPSAADVELFATSGFGSLARAASSGGSWRDVRDALFAPASIAVEGLTPDAWERVTPAEAEILFARFAGITAGLLSVVESREGSTVN